MSQILDIDPQRTAADPDLSAFVTANAGSGKTKTLIDRVARLLLAGAAPAAILCVTYTKAAAAEMRQRVADRLAEWALATEPADWEAWVRERFELGGEPPLMSLRDARSGRLSFALIENGRLQMAL